MDQSSWKTTLGGILVAIGQVATLAPIPPPFTWIPHIITAFGGALTGLAAKDADVHSTKQQVEAATVAAATTK